MGKGWPEQHVGQGHIPALRGRIGMTTKLARIAAKARKNMPVITPIVADEIERLVISSGAMTALETR